MIEMLYGCPVLDGWIFNYHNAWNNLGGMFYAFLKRQECNLGNCILIHNNTDRKLGHLYAMPALGDWDRKHASIIRHMMPQEKLLGIIADVSTEREEVIVMTDGYLLLIDDSNDNERLEFRIF